LMTNGVRASSLQPTIGMLVPYGLENIPMDGIDVWVLVLSFPIVHFLAIPKRSAVEALQLDFLAWMYVPLSIAFLIP
jgi:hypothetical protein